MSVQLLGLLLTLICPTGTGIYKPREWSQDALNAPETASGDGFGRTVSSVTVGPNTWIVVAIPGSWWQGTADDKHVIADRTFKFLSRHGSVWGITAGQVHFPMELRFESKSDFKSDFKPPGKKAAPVAYVHYGVSELSR